MKKQQEPIFVPQSMVDTILLDRRAKKLTFLNRYGGCAVVELHFSERRAIEALCLQLIQTHNEFAVKAAKRNALVKAA